MKIKNINEIKNAWKEIHSGNYKKMKSDDFLKEISKW